MTQQEFLDQLMEKHAHVGILKGSEFLVPPQNAHLLLNDLPLAGIVTLGITTWVRIDSAEYTGVAEELSIQFDVPDDVINSENAAELSNKLAQEFVNQITDKVDYISIDLYASLSWIVPNT